jgi:hypothetical protein
VNTVTVETQPQELNVVENVTEIALLQTDTGIEIEQVIHELSVAPEAHEITVTESPLEVTVASPGPQGPPGPSGTSSQSVNYPAGETLGGHRAVVIANGEAFYADKDTPSHAGQVVGVTTGAASAGNDVNIQFGGELEEPSWNWSPGPIYVDTNGQLTQTRPSSGWIMNIGVALTPTRIFIYRTASIKVA